MEELFLQILHMNLSASCLILAVLLLRVILKKAPKWIHVLLLGIVAVRLLCPFSIESAFSVLPQAIGNGDLVTKWTEHYIEEVSIIPDDSLHYDAAVSAGREPIYDGNGGYFVVTAYDKLGEPATIANTLIPVFSLIWILGILVLAVYTIGSYWHLRRKTDTAVLLYDNIFQSENVNTPFVLGIFRPRIYLPFQVDGRDLEHIIAHEQAHIRRKDHWWKPLGFLLVTIHWFNPLVWLAYRLLCRDIELACDEKVIQKLEKEQRADYAQALLVCSMNRRRMMVSPLAFGEVGVKERVKSVMDYKKPRFWVILLALILCIVIAVGFLTNPAANTTPMNFPTLFLSTGNTELMGANYAIDKVLYEASIGDEIAVETPFQYCVTADYHLFFKQEEDEDWQYVGALASYDLTNEELDSYMPIEEMRKSADVHEITDAYILKTENDNFYLVFQTKNGKTYLAYGWEDVGERGQAGSDDTRLRRLYLLENCFSSGDSDGSFIGRSLETTIGSHVYNFAGFTSDNIPGYYIEGFKCGTSANHTEMTDMGFAVFRATGDGYRLIDYHVYENAALAENSIYCCDHPAVADINGEMPDSDQCS